MKITTIPETFFRTSREQADKAAFHFFRDGWQTLTYREFADMVSGLATHLLRSGLSSGDRVGLISENRPEWCVAYLAIITAGGIAVPVDSQLGPDEVSTLLRDAESHGVFHSARTRDSLSAFRSSHPENPRLLLFDFDDPGFAGIMQSASASEFPNRSPEDIASIIYTSGTTGRPKGVVLTQRNFCSDAEAIVEADILSPADNVLSMLPLHHTYAFMGTFLVPIMLGGSVTYPASLKGPDLTAAIRERGVTILIGVPQVLGMIRNSIINKIAAMPKPVSGLLFRTLRLSGWMRRNLSVNLGKVVFRTAHQAMGPQFRYLTSGGAKLDPLVMQDLEALGFTVLEGYGLTETSPVVTFNPPRKRKPGSAGAPLPSVEIRISNPSAAGEGEIEIKGPMVMQGYYRNPSATADVLHDGWFRTGDIGRLDSDGYLFITGRSKEVIVMNTGKNIYPEEVEKLYSGSKLIREICVTGLGKDGITEALHGIVVPDFEYAKQAGISNVQEALKWEINELSSKMPSYMRITGYSIRKEPLPRTPLGKLRRFMIRPDIDLQAARETPAQAEDALSRDETGRLVVNTIRAFVANKPAIHADDHLELDLGLDSLSKIELVASLEKLFSVSLAEDFLADVQTVGELADKIRAHASGAGGHEQAVKNGWKKLLSTEPADAIALVDPSDPMIPSHVMYLLLKTFFRLFFRMDVKGFENVPRERNFILASNHTSYLDGFVVILALPFSSFRNIYSLGISGFFAGRIKGWFSRIAHVIPIDAAAYLNKALQMSAYVLRHGRSISVFPEGGRSFDGSLLEFKKGVGILAVELDVPVVPVFIHGAFEAFPRGAAFPRPKKVTVAFGRPLRPDEAKMLPRPQGVDEYQHFANVLRERVGELGQSLSKTAS
ncbi:MAG: AMP-binding protein [Thermodesulfovibrionales bacterium]